MQETESAVELPGWASKLLLILGPPGTGKSTVIERMTTMDRRFTYITPVTTRRLRIGESNKVFKTPVEFEALERAGDLFWVNELYGERYGTPRDLLLDAFSSGCFPLIDWPVQRVPEIRARLGEAVLTVYLRPPSVEALRERLHRRRSADESRIADAVRELQQLDAGQFQGLINLEIVSTEGEVNQICTKICEFYYELGTRAEGVGR